MDLRALHYFVAAVEHGSISAAAQRCYVAQPSITQAIAKLEHELNCQLLYRHARGVKPSAQGDQLYTMAKRLLDQAQQIHYHFNENQPPLRFSVSLVPSIRLHYVQRLLKDLQSAVPGIQMELVEDSSRSDLHITTAQSIEAKQRFFPMEDEFYALLCPAHHRFANQPHFALEQLHGESLIERRHCENRHLFERAVDALGIAFHTVAFVDNEEWARGLVAAGLGVTLAPVDKKSNDDRIAAIPLHIQGAEAPGRTVGIALSPRCEHPLRDLIISLYGQKS